MDDIVVFSCYLVEHIASVHKVLTLCKIAEATLKPNKCHFFSESPHYP